jgi:hypothetical protein
VGDLSLQSLLLDPKKRMANAVFADKIVAFSDFVFASRQKSTPLHQNK